MAAEFEAGHGFMTVQATGAYVQKGPHTVGALCRGGCRLDVDYAISVLYPTPELLLAEEHDLLLTQEMCTHVVVQCLQVTGGNYG